MASLLNMSSSRLVGSKVLPYDAEIEYLESTGTQWIDTHVLADLDTVVELRGAQTLVFLDNTFIASDNGSGTKNSFAVEYVSSSGLIFCMDGVAPLCRSYKGDTSNTWHDIKGCRDYMIVDDVLYEKTQTPSSFTTPYSLIMFAYGRRGIPIIYGKVRISYLKLFSSTTIIRDYIPVRVGQVGYMYDKVSGQLFGNSGTGAFILGPDKQ